MLAAVGTQGWETPLGEHRVPFKVEETVWRHPGTGALVPPGGRNLLHLLDVLESPSAEQLKSMEQMPQWRQRSVEASR